MQWPELVLLTEDGGGSALLQRSREEEEEDVRAGVKVKEGPPVPIYKEVDRWHARESRRPKK